MSKDFIGRFARQQRQADRLIVDGPCCEVFPDECPHFTCPSGEYLTDQPCQTRIVGGYTIGPEHNGCCIHCPDFDTWEEAAAWLAGDDTKGCSCQAECCCGRYVDQATRELCICPPCPKHHEPATARSTG